MLAKLTRLTRWLFMNLNSTPRPKGGGGGVCGRPRAAQVDEAHALLSFFQRAQERPEDRAGIDDSKEPAGVCQAGSV